MNTRANAPEEQAKKKVLRFVAGTNIMMHTLSGDLYETLAACLKELLKNAMAACQADDSSWDPRRVHVEFSLVNNHPLARGCVSLVCMDAGHGFREIDWDRFCVLGGNREDGPRTRHAGLSEKQVGRAAYFLLNSEVRRKRHDSPSKIHTGFSIMTRTEETGPVTLVNVLADCIGEDLPMMEIPSNDERLGAYKGRKGSFTVIVIPNSAYATADEIRHDLLWELPRPRVKSQTVTVLVDGQKLIAPPLPRQARTVKHNGSDIVAHLEQCNDDKDPRAGVWLTDLETNIRCVPCYSTMARHIVDPLQRRSLGGDIFVAGLMRARRTDSAGLNQDFLRGSWQEILKTLQLHIAPFALEVLDESDIIDVANPGHRMIIDTITLMTDLFGPVQKTHTPPPPPGGRPPGPPRGPRDTTKPPTEHKPPGTAIHVGGKVYYVVPDNLTTNEDIFAWVTGINTLRLNTKYAHRPKKSLGSAAIAEHIMACIFEAVAAYDNPGDAEAMCTRIGELRRSAKKK